MPNDWRNDPKVKAAIGNLRAQGCCMEDYGAMGDEAVIANGRAEYDRLLNVLCDAVVAAARATPPDAEVPNDR